MLTSGQARYLSTNINTFIGLLFVATFAFAMGLLIWHSASGQNPVADLLAESAAIQSANR